MRLIDKLRKINEGYTESFKLLHEYILSKIDDQYCLIGVQTITDVEKIIEWLDSEGVPARQVNYGFGGTAVLAVWGFEPQTLLVSIPGVWIKSGRFEVTNGT